MIESTKKERVHAALWVMRCRRCHRVIASASEREFLPDVVWCSCDEEKKITDKEFERKRIGARITQLRKEKGMTQQMVADEAGIQRCHIARIEAGKYSVGLDTLAAIGDTMDMQIDYVPKK